MSLQRENFKFELVLDKAETVIANTETQLNDLKKKLKLTEEQLNESCKAYLPLNPNEIYQVPPMEVYELYKKEKSLSEVKTTQIKNLLGDLKLRKKILSDMKEENEDLRLKVVNLKEEDIDKKILNYTIEENRKLEYKIKMQKERHVRLGSEFKAEMEHFAQTENENKILKEKIQQLEKKRMTSP